MDSNKVKLKFIEGRKDAFDWIYANYAKGMYAVCLRYTRNADEAADILQESFIKVYEKRKLFNPEYELGPWIKRIVINQALNQLRVSKKFQLVDDDTYFEEAEETLDIADPGTIKQVLIRILQELPEGYRAVFNMYVIDNLTHLEIADYLGISVNTSKTQLLKARRMIKTKLQEHNITSSGIENEQGI